MKAKLSHKKERTKDKKGIEDFMIDFYETVLEKYKFHYAHMKILSGQQAVAERLKTVLHDHHAIQMQRDYAEAFNMVFNGEIHADHFD